MNASLTVARINPRREIGREEWVRFAGAHPDLILDGVDGGATALHRAESSSLRIFWNNGCIVCGTPTLAIGRVMFQCAADLGAAVIDPRGRTYASFEDWEKRTRSARSQGREHAAASRERERRKWIHRGVRVLVGVAVALLVLWLQKVLNF